VENRFEEVLGVLHHRTVRFEIHGDGSPVDVVRVRATIGRTFGEHCLLTIPLMFANDRFKSFTFVLQLTLELLER